MHMHRQNERVLRFGNQEGACECASRIDPTCSCPHHKAISWWWSAIPWLANALDLWRGGPFPEHLSWGQHRLAGERERGKWWSGSAFIFSKFMYQFQTASQTFLESLDIHTCQSDADLEELVIAAIAWAFCSFLRHFVSYWVYISVKKMMHKSLQRTFKLKIIKQDITAITM